MTTGLRHIATEPANLNHKPFGEMDRKRSPQPHIKKSGGGAATDSDGSVDSNSLSVDSNNDHMGPTKTTQSKEPVLKRMYRRGSEWEILEGLKEGQRFDKKPEVFTGYLHKKRKWPLKGWHKRYFVVDKGIMVYGKSPGDVARGKIHGSVDIGLSVITAKRKRKRIDIDAEEFIHHLKAKQYEVFGAWVEQLKQHRLYRQHLLTYGTRDSAVLGSQEEDKSPTSNSVHRKLPLTPPELGLNREASVPCGKPCTPPPMPRLTAWLFEANPPLDMAARELNQAQHNLTQLQRILEQLDTASQPDSEACATEGFSPNVKKDRKKFGLRKKKSGKGSSVDLNTGYSPNKAVDNESSSPLSSCSFTGGLSTSPASTALSCSNPSLATGISSAIVARPQSLPGAEHHLFPPLVSSGTPENHLYSDFVILAKDVYSSLKSILYTLNTERERLKGALEAEGTSGLCNNGIVGTLRNSLHQSLQQNSELRARLNRIHENSDLSDLSEASSQAKKVGSCSCTLFNEPRRQEKLFHHFRTSYSSFVDALPSKLKYTVILRSQLVQGLGFTAEEILLVTFSASEFFDAEEYQGNGEGGEAGVECGVGVGSDTSSEAGSLTSEEGSVSSENSEMGGSEYNPTQNAGTGRAEGNMTGRRTKLPAPRPNTEGLSLWNLLCKNIGKDLSQVSMPVALNEPLNMLQRLCEELEYSELLDKASELSDPYERMVYVAAFAVSSYGSSYFRAGSKPFNPLLGETYECIREDKGFRFIAEQVSHHPPVSVCYAESKNFEFWQDARIKTKFWGKSMEFQPTGYVNVKLQRPDGGMDHFRWNKVTTCVHNLFGGQRWVDQYGELKITNNRNITCKLTFIKASYWSAKRHEVHGVILSEEGKVVRNLFGKWSEAVYCGVAPSAKCIWRPGTMPEDYEMYYGFTRFAMELNELDPEMSKYLPSTDTRFRPDQRLLEEGNLSGAEQLKLQLEQAQRERRKHNEQVGFQHEPKWFSKTVDDNGEEIWEYNHKYWEMRKNPGFVNMTFESLW